MNKKLLRENLNNLVILFTELAVIFLIVLNILPREAGLFLTGLLVFYFIFSPLSDSIWIFISSIPLFIALPISESFDSMANWRILLTVLFLAMCFKFGISVNLIKKVNIRKIRDRLKPLPIEYWAGLFLLINAFSIIVADNIWVGVKKLLFVINIFFLYIIIRILAARNKEIILKIVSAVKMAVGLTLTIGFVQLAAVFFVPLYTFWQFWARQVISVFYGQSLSDLLSYSNTWFSYYAYQPPTLRMFSVFPDSHSFAFFCILALPFFLTMIFLLGKESKERRVFYYLFLISCLLAIIFSGSRGTWVSALGALFFFLIIVLLYLSPTMRSWTSFFIPRLFKRWKKQMQLIVGSLVIFFILFPISSSVLLLTQFSQTGKSISIEKISLFDRARSIADFSEISAKSRLDIWQKTIHSIISCPLLGVGLGNFPLIIEEDITSAKKGASAHSLYLEIASETGILSLLILLIIFWYLFKDAWQIFTRHKQLFLQIWAGFFQLALIWVLGYSLFDVVLLNDKVLLFFVVNLGLLYAAKSSFGLRKSPHL